MADYEILTPDGHATLIAGLKQYARKPNSVNTAQLMDAAVTDEKLDPDGVIADVTQLKADMANVSIDVDDLGLEQDEETGLVYPTYRGERSANGIPLAGGGGGGGGGGSTIDAKLTVENTTGWISTSISSGAECTLSVLWSSIENGLPTGDGTLTVTVDNVVKVMRTVEQGSVSVDVAPFLSVGTRKVKVRITDVYDQSNVKTFTINVADLSVRSSFDTSGTFAAGATVDYTYTPVGAVDKLMHFEVDGRVIGTETVTTSGRQQTKTLPAMQHGSHVLRVWFTAQINGAEVTSNVLTHALVVVNPSSNVPIISSPFTATTATQYETIAIPYTVYTPNSLTSQVILSANGQQVSSLTMDRTEHTWSYRANHIGPLTLTIAIGTISKTFTLDVAASDIDVYAETANLSLYLTSNGRSNAEAHPEVWEDADNGISATLTDFNFVSDGWVTDEDGYTALRVANAARVTIPYQPFADDFRSTGKTLEFEFATRDIYDYDATVISCWSGDRGFKLTAQQAILASEQSNVAMSYKEDEHVRVSFVAEKRTENRLLLLYINGIVSGVVQYPDNDDFSQQVPVDITIGNDHCATDVYNIRVYDNNLTRYQVLNNWIADTQDVTLMLERYSHNHVYDEYGNVTIENLPSDLPYMVIEAEELPQYKGDKKTVSGYYVDPVNAAKSFSFTGCQINVQGTSSAVYDVKNFDLQFKNGFEMTQSGEHADNFALAPNVIPFNRFVLKADVASSEGANNVELVKLFCDTDPYKRPEELANAKVRKGIYGFPIVMFWHDTNANTTKFYGKANFNLPKRAPGPYGYSDEMESWEFQNNTSNLMLFLSDYFSMAPRTDPDTGETKETWRYDYEARFPSDEWVDIDKLQELQSFVYSTYRNGATDAALPSPVTYQEAHVVMDEVVNPETGEVTYEERLVTEDVRYTTDSAAYRLAKFKNEFGKYAEVDSFIFYYIFTELFLMVDSRAKNLFIGFSGGDTTGLQHIDRKAVAEPYDMDTAIGINNEGTLTFGYSLEDTDHLAGGANVFNGQNSVLWCNVRDAFGVEISQMYRTLRSNGVLSYATVEQRFEEHQSKWPEAIFNEDAWAKYINPLIAPASGKTATASYLEMAQGSKAEQRKWWLYNRFRYMDSKWTAGDARNNIIELRGYAKADITVTPYTDIYPAIRYASYTVTERGTHGVPTTLACPIDQLNDSEIHIFSAPQLASVGDLSALKVGRADFRAAVNLQSIIVGSAASGYENPNLTQLYVGNNSLLRTIDARNCTALAGALDFSGASNVQYVYLDGTKVTSVSLPVGGILKTLSLPSTITNLTIRDQRELETFSMAGGDYSGVTTLRIENCSSAVPMLAILDDMAPNSRVRIIGFTAIAETTTDVENFFDYLDTMRGLDEAGNNLPEPVVSGMVTGLDTITGAWLSQMNARYPDVNITYNHISSQLRYMSWDGETVLHTETVTDNGNGTWSGTPARTSTAQYSYTFLGWSRYEDQYVADPTAVQSVGADRDVYGAYSRTVRTYTVTWKNANGTTLETDQNVPYGTMPTYNGSTPTQDGETSTGWNPEPKAVEGDVTYTAVYVPVYQVRFYSGSTLLQTTRVREHNNAVYSGSTPTSSDGDYFEFTGWDKPLENIVANTDFYAKFRDTRSPVVQYVEGTMIDYFSDTATKIVQNAFTNQPSLTTVKTSASSIEAYAFSGCEKLTLVDLTNANQVSIGNMAFRYCYSLEALIIRASSVPSKQSAILDDSKIARHQGAIYVPSELVDTYKTHGWSSYIIASIDDYPLSDYSTIADSWSEIIASTNDGTADKYQVGDSKLVDLGDEGKQYMVVAKTSPNGITFISDGVLETKRPMNESYKAGVDNTGAVGGWEYSDMRAYLNDSIFPILPTELQSAISEETKYSGNAVDGEDTLSVDGCITNDKLWLPSRQEVNGISGSTSEIGETMGERYKLFANSTSRKKWSDSAGQFVSYWLRTPRNVSTYITVSTQGSLANNLTSDNIAFPIGFTIGTHPTEQELWEALVASISAGTLKEQYSIGDSLPLHLGMNGVLEMQIVAFDEDVSHVTFVSKDALRLSIRMNPANSSGAEGTGANGGWEKSEMRAYLNDELLPTVPSYVASHIVPITKYSSGLYAGALVKDYYATTDALWIPSNYEMTGSTGYETKGVVYTGNDYSARYRYSQSGSIITYWLRSAHAANRFVYINSSGSASYDNANNANSVVIGFSL